MPEVHSDAGTVTAFQPPPSPTHSVNPNHSAFGTTTLHADNRTTNPLYGRRPDWCERILVSACRQEVFIGGDPHHVAGTATATRECHRNDKLIRPAPPACVVPLKLDHVLYLSTNTPPRLPQPRQRGLRLLPQWFRHARFTSCLLYTSPSPRDGLLSRMPSSA